MAAPKTVKLKDRNGNECNVSTPADVVNLVYGSGYTAVDYDTPEEAVKFLAEKGVVAPQGDVNEQQAVEQTAVASGKRGARD